MVKKKKLTKSQLSALRRRIALKNFGKKRKKSNSTKSKSYKRMAKKKRKSYKRSSSVFGINTAKALSAAIYGALRSKTSNILAPYTSKIPLGNVSDEAGMLIATTLAKKYLFKRAGTMRDAMTAGQTIELARVGEAVVNGQLGINLFGMGSSNTSGNGYVFA